MQRDTVTVNPNSYVIIRFKADNSGVWLFHCHIEWHVVMGLIATIIESPDDLAGGVIPEDHQAICRSQNIPLAGNAAGNTQNFLDLSGALEKPPIPDRGPVFDPGCTGDGLVMRRGGRER
jgi:iron transport multicopper oxidase